MSSREVPIPVLSRLWPQGRNQPQGHKWPISRSQCTQGSSRMQSHMRPGRGREGG